MVGVVIVNAASPTTQASADVQFNNYKFIEDAKLDSSRYTRVDDLSMIDPSFYIPITNDDQQIAENDNFIMYFDETRVVFKVLNKSNGYVWSSALENPSAGSYTGLLNSGIGIEYINVKKDMFVEENVGITDTIFTLDRTDITNGVNLALDLGGYCSTRTCKRLYKQYQSGSSTVTMDQLIQKGYQEIGIGFDINVTLNDKGLNVELPYTSIREQHPDEILLSSVIVFPGLGATKMDQIPGYMVIPDGSGAMIRYEDNQNKFITPFEERYYGRNYGLDEMRSSVTNYPLSMPIFGAVHGVYQNAFVGIIEKGAENARLFAYPNGAHNINYNLIFTKFDYRQTYRQSFSSDGSGGAMKYISTYADDIQLQYDFLKNQDASYVGIGRDYRDYLLNDGDIKNLNLSGDISLYTDYLMADSETSFFGPKLVKMSTVSNIKTMYQYFIDNGITNQQVGLIGWNKGGYSGYLPAKVDFENSLGSNKEYQELIDLINQNNKVTLVNDLVFATSDTKGISYRTDVAKGSNRFKMEFSYTDGVHPDHYVLYPSATAQFAQDTYNDYVKRDVDIQFQSIGNTLFSYYQSDFYNRTDALAAYQSIMEEYQGKATYIYPFAYAYKYTDTFNNVPLYNSQLKYYDDLIPLIEIVLKGSMNLYAPYLNFNGIGREQILNLIDFGLNPSFILSEQPASKLKETDLGRYYTTEYSKWKDTVVEQYNYINDALKYVNGAQIVARDVLDLGIVKIQYSNNVTIYVNYTSSDYVTGTITIPSMDYYVGGVA